MKHIYTLLFFAITISLYGQEKIIRGRVIDCTNKPVQDMSVQIGGKPNSRLYTDKDGYFTINALPENYLYIGDPNKNASSNVIQVSSIKDDLYIAMICIPLRGIVYSSYNGLLEGITVEVVGEENKVVKTDATGKFSFSNISDNSKIKIYDKNHKWISKIINITQDSRNQELKIILDPALSPTLRSRKDTIGAVFLNENTPTLLNTDEFNSSQISAFRHKRNNKYQIKRLPLEKAEGPKVEYNGSISLSQIGRLPNLQSVYAQGSTDENNLSWQGADKNEIFSWGPYISSLEFDGSNYIYDKNGKLTTKGLGNGIPAKAYNSTDFFQTGFAYENSANIKQYFIGKSILNLNLKQSRINNPIPNSYREGYSGSLIIEKLKTKNFSTDVGIIASSINDKLMNNGASYARLLHSVLTTPITFDNANGLAKSKAVKTTEAWMLNNNEIRSYAPLQVNNPYQLVNQLTDKEKSKNIIIYGKTTFEKNKIKITTSLNFNNQWNDRQIQKVRQSAIFDQNILCRKEQAKDFYVDIYGKYTLNNKFSLNSTYTFNHSKEKVERQNNSIIDRLRNTNSFKYGASYFYDKYYIELANKHYFSNTATKYSNIFPSLGTSVNLDNIFYDVANGELINNFRLFGSASRSLSESPLIFHNPSVQTTHLSPLLALESYYEEQEIITDRKIRPEIYFNSEISLSTFMFNGKLNLEFSYFNNTTWNFISPINTGLDYYLENIGRVRNYGYNLNSNFFFVINKYDDSREIKTKLNLNFSRIRNKVTSITTSDNPIPLAGFSTIGTFFAKDEPVGSIYGSTYLRNEDGKMIIGDDGFPLVNHSLKKIGDPTPAYVLALSPYMTWRNFDFSFSLTYSHGGDRWNGTKAYLDYIGMSESSVNDRNIRGYIYDGVNSSGKPNSKLVDFYNPALPLSENKWVRYGNTGIGEEYIEDASFLRLSNISLSYRLFNRKKEYNFIKQVILKAYAQNLFLITSYDGVDPSSRLFGYATGDGLDFFNMPSTKSYHFAVTLQF